MNLEIRGDIMPRTMSATIDDSVVELLDRIAREKKMSKRRIIEEAIKSFWEKVHIEKEVDPFLSTFGAWKRDESAEETVRNTREAFNQSMQRHHVS